MAKTRRSYEGGALSTTTTSAIAASGTTSFTITAYTGWPYGADPFYVVVQPGTASEEKILVTRTGSTDTTINVASDDERGQDGTSAVSHASGSTVFPVFTAVDADEANELTSSWSAKGDLVSHGTTTFETLTVGTNDEVLTADSSTASGLAWKDTLSVASASVSGDLTVDTDTLHVDSTNDRVGINTASPDTALHVLGDGTLGKFSGTTNPRIQVVADDDSNPYILFGNSTDTGLAGLYYDSSTDDFQIRGFNFNKRINIDSSGNVDVTTGELRIGGTAVGVKTAFTPSWINLTPGNATETWFYTRVNDLVYVTGQTVFGSTTSIGGTFRIEYPIGTSSNLGEPKGWAFYQDDDTSTTYAGFIHPAFAGNVYFGTLDPSGSTYLTLGLNNNQNRPFTWAVDDKIRASFVYQIA